ncbi:unnamed protein product [Mytilus edulis]|uniref:Spermatogenesis-associated protein 17 n=1 Tax=Mytilus edulis TaxID=6550 RepID=A0A8S3RN29_MYTED|nr:unnamed protein product [Mytilus edulis]
MVRLLRQTDQIVEDSYERKNEAELQRQREYLSSVKIQANFRGSQVRSYFTHLNNCATVIQKSWRGYVGRQSFRVIVKNSVLIMKLNHFNAMATQVQKIWRGYYVRKYVYNYYSQKRYLEALIVKNAIVRSELEDYTEQQENLRRRQTEHEERKLNEFLARKNHHLISTEVIPGIYNSPFNPYPSEQEFLLRSVAPLKHEKTKKIGHSYDPTCRSYECPKPKQLPPIVVKPQGPFRDPTEVQKQRYKGFQPTLRVATSFTSLEEARQILKAEEWVTRLNDDIFQPFKRRDRKYEPLLHSTSKFGHLPFGTKYYREEFLDKHITPKQIPLLKPSTKPFKTLVPPIPMFDKLNDTYSQGQV